MKINLSAQTVKNNVIILLLTALLIIAIFSGCAPESEAIDTDTTDDSNEPNEIYINMDCKDDSLPKRFRKCNDPIDNKIGDRIVDIDGLDELLMSGSGQFSQEGLELVKQEIGDYSIYIVDLREESHGFANGISFSYMDKDNRANEGKSLDQIIDDENTKLDAIREDGFVIFPTDNDTRVDVVDVQTEESITESCQMSYLRLPVSNNLRPSDAIVDTFIAFERSLPKDTWLHFHCMEGVGRTTTFMFMHDAMHNAKSVSMEDIMTRQVLLGGKNLLQSGSKERSAFIEKFYQYCKENNDDFHTSWTEWST